MKLFKNYGFACIVAIFCCTLWASASPCIKLGYEFFSIQSSDTASILLFAGIRFALSGILVILAGSLLQKKFLFPTQECVKAIGILALFQTMGQYFFFYVGLAHTSSMNGAIISGTGAFISLLIAALIFRFEKLSVRKLLGCILGFIGILFMNLNGMNYTASLLGDCLVLGSQICSSLSAAFIKLFTKKFNAVLLSGYQFLLGGISLSIIGLCMGGSLSLTNINGLLILLHLAFVSACAYTLWGILLSYHDVSKIGIFNCLIPVIGVFLSAILLGENALQLNVFVALAFVCMGIYLVTKQKQVPSK